MQPLGANDRDRTVRTSTDQSYSLDPSSAAPTLFDLLSGSPLNRIRLEREPIHGPVRTVDFGHCGPS